MAAISVKELAAKLNDFLENNKDFDKEAMIRDTWVCSMNNRDYPEGTIIFDLIGNNATEEAIYESSHQLVIYPTKLGRLN